VNTILTYQQIEAKIRETVKAIEAIVDEIAEAAQETSRAEAAYQYKFACERISFRDTCERDGKKTTADQVTDWATMETKVELEEHLLAKNNLTVLRSSLSAKEETLSALRTLAASHRAAGG
jgi:hypothetical protein